MKKELGCMAAGAIAATGVKLFGGWTPTIKALLVCMIIDLVMGFAVAAVFKNSPKTDTGGANSLTMFKGLCKKFGMLCLLAVAHQIDMVLQVDYVMLTVTYGFIANEALSVVENAGLMGIVKSDMLTNAIDILKQKSDREK